MKEYTYIISKNISLVKFGGMIYVMVKRKSSAVYGTE